MEINGNYLISLGSSGSDAVTYRVVDTTLYQPAWSTYSSHYTQATIKNTTSSTVSCVYTVNISTGGSGSVSQTYSLGAGASIFPVIAPGAVINVSANEAGDATLACTGAPGSTIANAFMFNTSATVTFKPRNSQN